MNYQKQTQKRQIPHRKYSNLNLISSAKEGIGIINQALIRRLHRRLEARVSREIRRNIKWESE